MDEAVPEGCTEVNIWPESAYEESVKCDIHGYARFCRPLSAEELATNKLIPDPRSLLVGVMKG
jgi:hypothetical protein